MIKDSGVAWGYREGQLIPGVPSIGALKSSICRPYVVVFVDKHLGSNVSEQVSFEPLIIQ